MFIICGAQIVLNQVTVFQKIYKSCFHPWTYKDNIPIKKIYYPIQDYLTVDLEPPV